MEYSEIKGLNGLINYSLKHKCTYFGTHKKKYNTKIYKNYFKRRQDNDTFYFIVKEDMSCPKVTVFRVLSMNYTGQINIVNNFSDFADAKTEFFKQLCRRK